MQKNGRTLREDLALIRRGLKEFEAMLAGQMKHIYRRNFLKMCCFYLPIWLSAAVIEELLAGKNIDKLFGLITGTVLITFILTLYKNAEEAKAAVGYSYLFCAHEIHLTNHAHQIPFELLERNSTRQLRDWVSGSIQTFGGGMASLYWDMDALSANICSVLAALGFGIYSVWNTILQSRTGIDCGIFIKDSAGLLVLVGVCVWVSCKMAGRRFDVSFQIFQQGAKYQRYGDYFTMQYLSDENAALDARIYHQTDKIIEESQKNCYQPFWKGNQRELRALNECDGIKLLCSCVCGSVVYLTVAQQAAAGVMGAGSIVIFYAVVMQLIEAFHNAAQTVTDLRNNNEHLIRYFEYMDLAENTKEEQQEQVPLQCCKEITFCNVGFRYPESEKWVLKNISFTIKRGEKITIVGENGSGKTTLIKLLCRLYQPTEGEILLNGHNIQSYSYAEYMGYISAVFQDFALFAFPLAENISASSLYKDPCRENMLQERHTDCAVSREDKSDKSDKSSLDYQESRVWNCLDQAGIKEKVSQWEQGIRQPLFHDFDENGVDLSGGEAQKAAIARALYKESQIMILDEPTAALDPYAEAELFENFYRITSDNTKTVLFISHRMSSCRMCDRIIVLDKGCLIQCGSHEQLLEEKEQKYYKMWNAQAQYYI